MELDLDFIQENLGNFATFGKNIGTALQDIPELLKAFFEFFGNLDALSSNNEVASSLPQTDIPTPEPAPGVDDK